MFKEEGEAVAGGGSTLLEEEGASGQYAKVQVKLPTHTLNSVFNEEYNPEFSWPPAPLTTDEHDRPVSRGTNAQLKLGKTQKYKPKLGLNGGPSTGSQPGREPMPVAVQEFGFVTKSNALNMVEKYKKKVLYGTVLKAREKALDKIFEKKNKSLENKLKMRPQRHGEPLEKLDLLNGYASPLRVKPIDTTVLNKVQSISRLSLVNKAQTPKLKKKKTTKSLPALKTIASKTTTKQYSLNFNFTIGETEGERMEKQLQVDKEKLQNMSSSLVLKEFSDLESADIRDWNYPQKILRPTSAPTTRPNTTPTIVNGMYQGSRTLAEDSAVEDTIVKRPVSADTFLRSSSSSIVEEPKMPLEMPQETLPKKPKITKKVATLPPKLSVPSSPNSSQSGLLYSNPSEMRVSSPSKDKKRNRGSRKRKGAGTAGSKTANASVIISVAANAGGFTPESSMTELVPWETSDINLLNRAVAISRERSSEPEKGKVVDIPRLNPAYKLAEDRLSLPSLRTESNLALTVTHAVPQHSPSQSSAHGTTFPPRKRPGQICSGVVKHNPVVHMELASADDQNNDAEGAPSTHGGRELNPQFRVNVVNRRNTVSLKKTEEEKDEEESKKKEIVREIFVEPDCFEKKPPPPGWQRHYDSKGKPFYLHKKSSSSQRVYPTKHDVKKALKKSKLMEREAKAKLIKKHKKVQRSKKGERLIERLNATVWEQRER
jgi:hypothetical protein